MYYEKVLHILVFLMYYVKYSLYIILPFHIIIINYYFILNVSTLLYIKYCKLHYIRNYDIIMPITSMFLILFILIFVINLEYCILSAASGCIMAYHTDHCHCLYMCIALAYYLRLNS